MQQRGEGQHTSARGESNRVQKQLSSLITHIQVTERWGGVEYSGDEKKEGNAECTLHHFNPDFPSVQQRVRTKRSYNSNAFVRNDSACPAQIVKHST